MEYSKEENQFDKLNEIFMNTFHNYLLFILHIMENVFFI